MDWWGANLRLVSVGGGGGGRTIIRSNVLGPLLFLIMTLTSTRMYLHLNWWALQTVGDIADCDNLQLDLNAVYDWASSKNMFFNSKKFSYVCFSSNMSAYKSNLYIDPAMNIIAPSTHVRDLGVSMSSNCTFDFHISNRYKRCSNLAGWILRTFTIRDPQVMLTLYKSLVMSRLEYASQLWSPYLLKHVYLIEKVQRAFTKHISGMCSLSYSKRLEVLITEKDREIWHYLCVEDNRGIGPKPLSSYHLLFLWS